MILTVQRDRRSDIHVLPADDCRPHFEQRDCWCVPDLTVVEPTLTVIVRHHASDGRERLVERVIQQ